MTVDQYYHTFKKRALMAAAPPRNPVKYWNLKNPIHCSSRDFKLDFLKSENIISLGWEMKNCHFWMFGVF